MALIDYPPNYSLSLGYCLYVSLRPRTQIYDREASRGSLTDGGIGNVDGTGNVKGYYW